MAGARTVAGRIVEAAGEPLRVPAVPALTHVFPAPAALAAIDPARLPMPASRRRTITELATRVGDGRIVLDGGADRDELSAALGAVPGIGPWTTGYVLMRGLGDPDVFLPTDFGARAGLARLGVDAEHAERWRPWRSYALHHLWAMPKDRRNAGLMPYTTIDTPIGPLTLIAADDGLRGIRFGTEPARLPEDDPAEPDHPVLVETARQLGEYFAGERQEFDLPLQPAGTAFQLAAWRALTTIPYGRTVSYGEQARRLGHAGRARAVGAANGSNPLPIVVPVPPGDRCRRQPHRVRRRPRDQGLAARPRTPRRRRDPAVLSSSRPGGGRGRPARGAAGPRPASCGGAPDAWP